MNRDQQRLPDYLGHILEAIDRIDRYISGQDLLAFMGNAMAQDAVTQSRSERRGQQQHRQARSGLRCRTD